MSTYHSEYTVTVSTSLDSYDRSSARAELEERYGLSWSARDAIATALEELAAELRSQED